MTTLELRVQREAPLPVRSVIRPLRLTYKTLHQGNYTQAYRHALDACSSLDAQEQEYLHPLLQTTHALHAAEAFYTLRKKVYGTYITVLLFQAEATARNRQPDVSQQQQLKSLMHTLDRVSYYVNKGNLDISKDCPLLQHFVDRLKSH